MRTIAVIPARLQSTRLPEKPLAIIAGRPMIAHVIDAVQRSGVCDDVVVATDSERIADAAKAAGARPIMTSPECPSGTDRVSEAVRRLAPADIVLNIQGDEPLLPPECVVALRDALIAGLTRGVELATLARPLEASEAGLSQVVKVVLAEDSTALYFSRSLVPYPRTAGHVVALAHVGLYAYTPAALGRLAGLAPTALERTEGLEQLRALGHGMKIGVATGAWKTQAVDTPEDLEAVRAQFAKLAIETRSDP